MRAYVSAGLVLGVAAALGASLVFSPSASSGAFDGSGQDGAQAAAIVAAVQDAGTLARATEDLYAATFVATGFDSDGGSGGYALMCNGEDCLYKLAEGTQMEMRATGNTVSFVTSAVALPTTFADAYACKSAQNCFFFADVGRWMYFFPTTDVSGCVAGTAGGVKFRSTDGRLVNCDGSAARPLTREVDGAVQLPTYTTATLPAVTPAGRLVYDIDAACVKFTNGVTWACI